MALYDSITAVGAKEDVSDIITNLTPTKTQFVTSIKKEKIHDKDHRWYEDNLRSVQANVTAEGADAVDETLSPVVERTNTTQILRKVFKISDTVEAISYHGRQKETAYQSAKAAAELKRDLEYACIGTKQTKVTGLNRQFAGAQAQIDASMLVKTGNVANAITEAHLLTALQKAWNEGAEVTTIMVTGDDAITIADFAKAAGRYRTFESGSKGDSQITNVVDIYVAPWGGPCKVVSSMFLAAGDTLIYDPSQFALLSLIDWTRETLGRTGLSTKMQISGEFSLKHKNYKASALVRRAA